MSLCRRQWLTVVAGAAASGLTPELLSRAANAGGTDNSASPRLCLLLDAGDINDSLRRGIEGVAQASHGITDTSFSMFRPGDTNVRLNKLVENLQQLQGQVLLGAICEHRALVLEEALREVGAAWLSRGEHVQVSQGYSRHRLISSSAGAREDEIVRFSSSLYASPAQWAEAVGRGMATRVLAPRSTDPLLTLKTLAGAPATRQRDATTVALLQSASIVTFVARI